MACFHALGINTPSGLWQGMPVWPSPKCGKPNNGGFPSDEFESVANWIPVNAELGPGGSIVLDLSVYVFMCLLACFLSFDLVCLFTTHHNTQST